jgi:hypothetical protein
MTVGILAFGSIATEPGPELQARVVRLVEGVQTPFHVEFARSSRTRGGGPTLAPVASGGARVSATVLVLEDSADEELARDLLYRRETRRIGENVGCRAAGVDWIVTMADFGGLRACLYAALRANIERPTPARLADLALQSAAGPAGEDKRDGISYLEEQTRRAIRTPLMPAYTAEVLARTGARNLSEAWALAREGR